MSALLVSNIAQWSLALALAGALALVALRVRELLQKLPPAGALMIDRGPPVGERAPAFTVAALDGALVTIGSSSTRSQLLLFVSSTCPVCAKLLPIVDRIARAESDWLELVLVGDGEPATERARLARYRLRETRCVLSAAVGRRFQIGRLPYAVLLDESGVIRAKGLVNSRPQLESLFVAKERGVASLQDFLRSAAPTP
jgi:methylamine dehydrogenase accessory protein MauD